MAFTSAGEITNLVGVTEAKASEAAEIVTAAIQSYCGQTFTRTTATLRLAGTPRRRLVLGERPVTAISSVTLDGIQLDTAEYRWSRRGTIYRTAGWLDDTYEVAVAATFGYMFIPDPIAAVCRTAAARFAVNPEGATYIATDGGYSTRYPNQGFTLAERMILDRFRRTSWPTD